MKIGWLLLVLAGVSLIFLAGGAVISYGRYSTAKMIARLECVEAGGNSFERVGYIEKEVYTFTCWRHEDGVKKHLMTKVIVRDGVVGWKIR